MKKSAKKKTAPPLKKSAVAKLPSLHKTPDITLKRGYTASAQPATASEKEVNLKKLPGKKKPPTLTLKRTKQEGTGATKAVSKKLPGKRKPPTA